MLQETLQPTEILKFWQHATLEAAQGIEGVSADWHPTVPTGTSTKVPKIASKR